MPNCHSTDFSVDTPCSFQKHYNHRLSRLSRHNFKPKTCGCRCTRLVFSHSFTDTFYHPGHTQTHTRNVFAINHPTEREHSNGKSIPLQPLPSHFRRHSATFWRICWCFSHIEAFLWRNHQTTIYIHICYIFDARVCVSALAFCVPFGTLMHINQTLMRCRTTTTTTSTTTIANVPLIQQFPHTTHTLDSTQHTTQRHVDLFVYMCVEAPAKTPLDKH